MMIKEINLAESAEHLEDPRVSVTKCQVLINPYITIYLYDYLMICLYNEAESIYLKPNLNKSVMPQYTLMSP